MTIRNVFSAALALTLAAGCAKSSTVHSVPNTTPEVLIDAQGRVFRTTDAANTVSYPAAPDETFRAVVAAYTKLGIDPSTIDATQRLVSRQGLLLRSKFQGDRLSTAFDCGSGQFGPRADDGRILADVTSRVAVAGSTSTVTTTVQASLTTNDGASRDPIRCVSNGGIEEKLRREVSLALGVPYRSN